MAKAYVMTITNIATQVVTKAANGERLHEEEEYGTLVVVVVVVAVDGVVVDGLSLEGGEEEEDGDLDGVVDEPDSTVTASFMPFPQWPITPQMK